jgi:putative flippase GtrA
MLGAGAGGVVATGLDLAVLVTLVRFHVPVPLASFVAALAGAAAQFAFNKVVAFRDRSPFALGQLARFHGVAVVSALLLAGAMKVVSVELGVPVVVAKLACAALVFAVWSYPAQRRLVFRPAPVA